MNTATQELVNHYPTYQVYAIQLDDIHPSPMNPRKHFDDADIQELASSIYANGLISPIVVRPHPLIDHKYEIVAGERRYRATQLIREQVPGATTINSIIKEITDEQALEIMIIENLQRKDISPMEEAAGFLQLIKVKHMDAKEIGAKVAKSPSYIAKRMKLNDLIDPWQKFLHEGHMTITDALILSSMSPQSQEELFTNEIGENHGLSSGEIYEFNNWTLKKYQSSLVNPPFDPSDVSLVPDMGACGSCKFNSSFDGLLFPELAANPVCRNSACFQKKCTIAFDSRFKAAVDDPTVILVTGEWSPSKQTSTLIKKAGEGVLGKNDYHIVKCQAAPEFEDFSGNNDTIAEDREQYEEALKQHAVNLEAYNKAINSGKYKRAFVLGGDDKGREVFVKVDTKKAESKAKKKPTAAEVASVTPEEIKQNIQDIKDREKRAIELDDSKVWAEVTKLIGPISNTKEISGNLSPLESKAIAMAIYDKLAYHRRDDFRKMFGLKGKAFSITVPGDIDADQVRQMLRFFFLDVLPTPQIHEPFTSHPKVQMMMLLAEAYWPSQVEAIKRKQSEVATRRAQRVKDRIDALNKELKALSSPSPAVKAVGTKAAAPKKAKAKKEV